ncbi:Carbamate kinase 1 [Serratia quinivorans]|uniref:carbamate kinase n=1 Tax=Serratia quinivorans TaxID=137545 RepID=UPI000D846D43|nr:carbamate kinase [Serratia quinivorans]SPZ59707.1 Carbamate kinase 1 [Serratia quinivorans]VEI72064.1 Carbamate kinase 1 [Serratia quinivorans]
MRILIALGGNALLNRGEAMTAENQRRNIVIACEAISRLDGKHQIIISHGNGPQVGLLALQSESYADKVEPYPFDVLGAESQGMIGYMLEQELRNHMPGRQVACLLTQVEVDINDPAVKQPNKFIGPVYNEEQAKKLMQEKGWIIKPDGKYYRRVVPSPQPLAIVEIETLRTLVNNDVIVIAGGGGGIPVTTLSSQSRGLEAVIDKDRCCSLMAQQLDVDLLIIATDVSRVFTDFGTVDSKAIKAANPHALLEMDFPAGSMWPKIQATCEFSINSGRSAVIGSLEDIVDMVDGRAGTLINKDIDGVAFH